jgi:hypothetical protein
VRGCQGESLKGKMERGKRRAHTAAVKLAGLTRARAALALVRIHPHTTTSPSGSSLCLLLLFDSSSVRLQHVEPDKSFQPSERTSPCSRFTCLEASALTLALVVQSDRPLMPPILMSRTFRPDPAALFRLKSAPYHPTQSHPLGISAWCASSANPPRNEI